MKIVYENQEQLDREFFSLRNAIREGIVKEEDIIELVYGENSVSFDAGLIMDLHCIYGLVLTPETINFIIAEEEACRVAVQKED